MTDTASNDRARPGSAGVHSGAFATNAVVAVAVIHGLDLPDDEAPADGQQPEPVDDDATAPEQDRVRASGDGSFATDVGVGRES